jgi:hypothetical protein
MAKKCSVKCVKLRRGIPRGDALGEYSNIPSHVHWIKQSRKKDTKSVCEDHLAQIYFNDLHHKKKVKGITLLDGLLRWKQSRIYVPKGKLSTKVVQEVPTVGHHGEKTTRKLLEKTFYWPEMKENV